MGENFGTSGRNNRQNFEHNGLKPSDDDLEAEILESKEIKS